MKKIYAKSWLKRGSRRVASAGFAVLIASSALWGVDAVAQKKITLEEFVIEGNIQKPEAFFILPRTNLNFEDLERREDLKDRIIKSVEFAPF